MVFDVYIEHKKKKVWLVDFNPFSPTTDSLLFTWEELYDLLEQCKKNEGEKANGMQGRNNGIRPIFRLIQSEQEVRIKPALGVPVDVLDVSSTASIERFADLMRENKLF